MASMGLCLGQHAFRHPWRAGEMACHFPRTSSTPLEWYWRPFFRTRPLCCCSTIGFPERHCAASSTVGTTVIGVFRFSRPSVGPAVVASYGAMYNRLWFTNRPWGAEPWRRTVCSRTQQHESTTSLRMFSAFLSFICSSLSCQLWLCVS